MSSAQPSDLVERWSSLRAAWRAGSRLSDSVVTEVSRENRDAVFRFYWAKDTHEFGLRIPLYSPFREFGYGTPLESWDQWMDTFEASLLAHLDTGLVENAARVWRNEYIEFRVDEYWPFADGFDYEILEPIDQSAIAVRATGLGYSEETITAEVIQTGTADAILTVEENPAVDAHARLDAVHLACHLAASRGVQEITAAPGPDLEIVGFRSDATRSLLALDTSFRDEDFDKVRRRFR